MPRGCTTSSRSAALQRRGTEVLEHVQGATARPATPEEGHKLRGLDEPIIATLTTDDGRTIEVAASRRDRAKLLAPFDVDVDDDLASDATTG